VEFLPPREVPERGRNVGGKVNLPTFVNEKDFEHSATVVGMDKQNYATELSSLLSDRVLEVYSRLSDEDALNYDCLKVALLKDIISQSMDTENDLEM